MVVNEDVKKTLDALNKKSGLPLGFLFAWPFPTPPDGAIQCNGAQYNRALYADFYAYISSKGWVKTEAEWQSIASQNNGYCSYYSDGDGSTTFRTPKFAPFMQIAIASGNVGSYHEAGLPNISGKVQLQRPLFPPKSIKTGAFSTEWHGSYRQSFEGSRSANGYLDTIVLDASRSGAVYGLSDTVQPESSEWMICVVVFGVATNVGSADVGNVMSAVAQVQAKLPNNLSNTTPLIVDTWKSGESGYRVWSDGFIEQWSVTPLVDQIKGTATGVVCTLPHAFTSTNYLVASSGRLIERQECGAELMVKNKTKTTFNAVSYSLHSYYSYYACGY